MGISDYKKNLKEGSHFYREISQMNMEELLEKKRELGDLKSNYDSWGTAQSINTERYYDVVKRINELEATHKN